MSPQHASPLRGGKTIRLDVAAARAKWIDNAKGAKQRRERETSDILAYCCDHSGRYADFHSLRHTFIAQLSNAGISPRISG